MIRLNATLLLTAALVTSALAQSAPNPRPAQLEAKRELIGKVLNYEYMSWSDLRVVVNEDGINWEGVGGAL